jgi:hypothetical protein
MDGQLLVVAINARIRAAHMDDGLAALSVLATSLRDRAMRAERQSCAVGQAVESMSEAVGRLSRETAGCQDTLVRFAPGDGLNGPGLDAGGESSSLDDFAVRYTMLSEREIHAVVTGARADGTEAADDLDDNIELF